MPQFHQDVYKNLRLEYANLPSNKFIMYRINLELIKRLLLGTIWKIWVRSCSLCKEMDKSFDFKVSKTQNLSSKWWQNCLCISLKWLRGFFFLLALDVSSLLLYVTKNVDKIHPFFINSEFIQSFMHEFTE